MRFATLILAAATGGLTLQFAHAQMATARTDELVAGMLKMTESRCGDPKTKTLVKDLTAQGKTEEAFNAASSIKMLCECTPARAHLMLKKMSEPERSARLSEKEFATKYTAQVVQPCAGQSLKDGFGEGCAARLKGSRPNSEMYCGCLYGKLNAMSDSEIGEMAHQNAAYIPAATAARKQGKPLPPRPPELEKMKAFDTACSAN